MNDRGFIIIHGANQSINQSIIIITILITACISISSEEPGMYFTLQYTDCELILTVYYATADRITLIEGLHKGTYFFSGENVSMISQMYHNIHASFL
jgi:hypothetical protein